MKLTNRIRQYLRLQSAGFTVLFIAVLGLAAWASTRYSAEADWTYGNRNTLSQPSQELLQKLDKPLEFQAFASEEARVREQIRDIAHRYTRTSDKVSLSFVDPKTHPQKVRELGIQRQGTIVLRYAGRTAKVSQYEEAKITNAIKRLADTSETKLAFVAGHGERGIRGRSRSDLTAFRRGLENQGYATRTVNLAQVKAVPEEISVLVVADPQQKMLPQERKRIRRFVERGGNLLWLADGGGRPLPDIGDQGDDKRLVSVGKETVASPVQVFGARSRAFGVVTEYSGSKITQDFGKTTVFPKARPVAVGSSQTWTASAFLQTGQRAWADAAPFDPRFDKQEDRKGPVTLGYTLTRTAPKAPRSEGKKTASSSGEPAGKVIQAAADGSAAGSGNKNGGQKDASSQKQRMVVIGDADFLSNGFIGFGGNRDLAMKTVKWLSGDTAYIDISTPQAPGQNLAFSASTLILLQALFMGILPVGFLVAGGLAWARQRRR